MQKSLLISSCLKCKSIKLADQKKSAEWILKNATQGYTVYKRLVLDPKTQISWKQKDEKRYFMQIVTIGEQAILISHETDFNQKKVRKKQKRISFINKSFNTAKDNNSSKYLHT